MPESGIRTKKGKSEAEIANRAYMRGYREASAVYAAFSAPVTKGDLFLRSREWRAVRDAYLATAEWVCVNCGSKENLLVDHIKPRFKFPELALTATNFQVLCWRCNGRKNCITLVPSDRTNESGK